MFNLLRADSYRLKHSKVWFVLMAIIAALTFMLVFFPYLEEIGVFDKIESVTVETHPDQASFSSIDVMIEVIYAPDVFFLVIIFSALGAFFIASENSNGTIKNAASTGNKRSFIYISKMTIFTLGSIVLALLFYITPAIFGSLFFGVGELPASEILINTWKVFIISMLYYAAFTSIISLFSMMCRGSGMALLFSLGFYLVAGGGLSFLSAQYTFWEKISEYSVFNLFSNIGERVTEQGNIIHLTMVPLITFMVFSTLGVMLFKRKDIQ